ncbi:Bifunctional NAD(P)H-hydrate repair enzyme Nnr [Campylobacter majalis]|uniref:Bifunctional NAD(P)H-hydrate repair enzyme n=1 Tax=Campylobacter majalis TaxID=2790656 RepID=A0ABN7K6B9_9BACT|nr:NAD(P)H-hydrate dehydratase [Campylobacter majalis]CAD7288063.1 Bifunctional NAD(P)H-hydrate repair enzyme Nnr [Campylobacter majalis]
MKNLYINNAKLDKRAIKKYNLNDEILMQNAAIKMANHINKRFKKAKILCVCGGGNNAADVYAMARILQNKHQIMIYQTTKQLKPLAKIECDRAIKSGVKFITKLKKADIVVDGIFGIGLNRKLSDDTIKLIKKLNSIKAYKIACDVPSGLSASAEILGECFKADVTITMGALKTCLYTDFAKDYVGKIKVANLGISRQNYEIKTKLKLLQRKDLKLPYRDKKCVNKGDFGHAAIICGKHQGAAKIAAKAAFSIGAGLVSVVGRCDTLNSYLMSAKNISDKMNAVAVGMGLSDDDIAGLNMQNLSTKSLVLDAGMCDCENTLKLLSINKKIVLTPHPKEFVRLLKLANLADIVVSELQNNRLYYALKFTRKFKCVLVLKGANTIIASNKKAYFMPYGTPTLAKGGSGDCLSGLIAGLMAQGYSPKKAAISGVLAHALSIQKFSKNFSLNANDIIKGIRCLAKK